jgi:uncharacterized protein (DUF2147 family)
MRRSLLLVVALSLLPVHAVAADPAAPPAATLAPAPAADAILGRWKPPEDEVVVAITKGPSGYEGAIVESPKNPSAAGKQMFRGLVYDASRAEWTGEVFAVKKGEWVPAAIKLSKEGFLLTAGKGFFSRKLTWTRG